LALLRQDYKAFHDALDTADRWLGQYFKGDAPAVDGMRQSLKKLSSTQLQPQLPDLSGTLKALRDWRAAHMNKTASLDRRPSGAAFASGGYGDQAAGTA
ncbi:MAG TPA: uroporphyrinogen-III C-methyltransferase, partial [Gammaproteobacteria bacterium]|nr:uroporphyrinogen-III C-methyltransferase [Gammaproteobacteria bacterium]